MKTKNHDQVVYLDRESFWLGYALTSRDVGRLGRPATWVSPDIQGRGYSKTCRDLGTH